MGKPAPRCFNCVQLRTRIRTLAADIIKDIEDTIAATPPGDYQEALLDMAEHIRGNYLVARILNPA